MTGKTEDVFVVNPTKLATEQKQPGYEILISNVDGLADDLADAQTAQKLLIICWATLRYK